MCLKAMLLAVQLPLIRKLPWPNMSNLSRDMLSFELPPRGTVLWNGTIGLIVNFVRFVSTRRALIEVALDYSDLRAPRGCYPYSQDFWEWKGGGGYPLVIVECEPMASKDLIQEHVLAKYGPKWFSTSQNKSNLVYLRLLVLTTSPSSPYVYFARHYRRCYLSVKPVLPI